MGSPILDYLPSKNFVKAVGSIITILVVGWLVLYVWDLGKNSAGDPDVTSGEEIEAEANKDTDNDGLLDWEEALWKTNPEIMDTDGDGTSDGDEVKIGRDPRTVGVCPSTSSGQTKTCTDKLQSPEEISKNKNSDGENTTFTAKIAEEFGKNYFAGKGVVGGEALSASAQESLADSIALGIEQGIAAYQDIFKKEDVKTSPTLDAKTYLNKLGGAFSKNFKNVSGSELDIISIIVSGEHFKDVKLFNPMIEAYKNMTFYLQKETAPETYAGLHLSAMNIMQNTLFAIRSIKEIEEDPAKAIVGMRLYMKESERTEEFLKNLKKQVEKDKITFAENDGGYFFNKYFEQI